ncbi:MAG TPA: response regulator [Bryobacteraceae bacterium]|nr:response regulator [Bryobacteraceae bacterium]
MSKARREVRILLVEDNATNQEVTLRSLEHLGYGRVEIAGDGRQALTALSARDFDLVLMDCHLPVIDGYDTCREIRNPASAVRNHQVPVVALTAAVLESDRRKCFAAGMNGYLAKPLRLQALESAIEQFAAGEGPATAPAEVPEAPNAGNLAPFDGETFAGSVMGSRQLARRIIYRFVEDMPRQIALLAQAVSEGDASQVRLLAHSTKGAAASVSGEEMRAVSWELERCGRDGDLAGARDAVRELSASFERARRAMISFCEGSGRED